MKKITLWMLAAILTLSGSMTLTSCSDKDSEGSGSDSPEVIELKNKLKGQWVYDTDGLGNLDMSWVNIVYDDHTMQMSYFVYDYSAHEYVKQTFNYDYQVLENEEVNGKQYARLCCNLNPDQKEQIEKSLRELYERSSQKLDDEQLENLWKDDYFLVDFVDGNLELLHTLSDVPEDYQDNKSDFIIDNKMTLTKGNREPADVDTTYVRAIISEAMVNTDNMNNLDAEGEESDEVSASRRASRRANYVGYNGRKLEAWMKDVGDNVLVRNMLLPGTHDAATYNLYGDWMWTLARTQGCDIAEQWNRGIRCFDLRTRWMKVDVFHDFKNEMFHECMDCGVKLEEILDAVVKQVKANPTEGAVLMIKTETNAAGQSHTINKIFRPIINSLLPAGIDFSPSEKVPTMKETARLVNEKLYKPGLLAAFKSDMTMKDLRGKVLVLLQEAPNQGEIDYGAFQDYLGNWRKDGIYSMKGEKLSDIKEQNQWEQNKEPVLESEDAFVIRKTQAFREMLNWSAQNQDGNTWIYNAANAYFWDSFAGNPAVPDYASYAQRAYPIFTSDIARMGDPRGIVLLDFVGQEEFKRVSLDAMAGAQIVMIAPYVAFFPLSVLGLLPTVIAETHYLSPLFYGFWIHYYIVKMFSHWKKPGAQALINTIVEVNIPKKADIGISDDPIDYGRSREITE